MVLFQKNARKAFWITQNDIFAAIVQHPFLNVSIIYVEVFFRKTFYKLWFLFRTALKIYISQNHSNCNDIFSFYFFKVNLRNTKTSQRQ